MKTRVAYEEALALAEQVKATLGPGCARIEIAGSVRRKKAEIGDLELVAIPKIEATADLFGGMTGSRSLLDEVISAHYRVIYGGKKFKQLDVGLMTCDLFIQPDPRTWGMNLMIRTGCAEFSRWMVTPRQKGGALPSYMYAADGLLFDGVNMVPTPEEADVFAAMGLRWIEPEERTQGFWNQAGGLTTRNRLNG